MTSTKAMRFAELDGGCFVCVSHAIRPDGYLRKEWRVLGNKVVEYFHVFIWKAHNGKIPDGCEIDHICHNRSCCNPHHLQAIPISRNRAKKNPSHDMMKYESALAYWVEFRPTIRQLSDRFGISRMTATRWIRKWKS